MIYVLIVICKVHLMYRISTIFVPGIEKFITNFLFIVLFILYSYLIFKLPKFNDEFKIRIEMIYAFKIALIMLLGFSVITLLQVSFVNAYCMYFYTLSKYTDGRSV